MSSPATIHGIKQPAVAQVILLHCHTIEASGTSIEGYFLCASLAGLVSGVLPHQGLTNYPITGYTDVTRTINKFNRDELNTMAGAGTWIVTQDRSTGQIYTRHALTTGDQDDVNQREEMLTRNVDSISFRYKNAIAPYIGKTNVTTRNQRRIELELDTLKRALQTENDTVDLGPQLIDAIPLDGGLRPHDIFRDRYTLALQLDLPYPFNNMDIHLVVP